jgi:hypothetical protein
MSPETSVDFHRTAPCSVLEDRTGHTQCSVFLSKMSRVQHAKGSGMLVFIHVRVT